MRSTSEQAIGRFTPFIDVSSASCSSDQLRVEYNSTLRLFCGGSRVVGKKIWSVICLRLVNDSVPISVSIDS
jgi:hypothetical protein